MCAILKSPGELGADIVTAEGQSLGNAMSYGGPFLGMMGVTTRLVRKLPGRIAGEARDHEGRRGFVLTLTAREQHIRREKAVSNICSNQGLVMLQTCVYLATWAGPASGPPPSSAGTRPTTPRRCIASIPGFAVQTRECFFEEFTVRTPVPAEASRRKLTRRGMVPGLPLSRYYP